MIDCEEGWKQDRKQDGSPGQNCYKLSSPNDTRTWHGAQYECAKSGAHLAHIEDDETSAFYEHLVNNYIFRSTKI